MAEVIRMPRMSDTMEEGVLVEWHKKEGDKVSIGELLAEIETDKATMDFESPVEGTLLYVGAKKGDAVPIDGVLAIVGEKGEDYQSLLEAEQSKPKAEEKEESKKEPAPQPEPVTPEPSQPATVSTSVSPATKTTTTNGRIKASPLAKRLAEENAVNLSQVQGSGDDGRIIKRDIEALLTAKPAMPEFVGEERYDEISLSQMRKTIAKRLVASKFSAPHFYLTMEINMDKAVEARKSINEEVEPKKISFNDLIIKAVTFALRKHPDVNASWQEDKIRINHHIHIGVAVAIDEGLIVPVVKFADGKSLTQLSEEVQSLAQQAREGTVKLDQLQGNTFTISNLGMFDIDEFTAIINPPDACILAVGKIKKVPVIKDDEVIAANMMKVTLSCDHRVVDGAKGARFLQTFKAYLEDPIRMFAKEF